MKKFLIAIPILFSTLLVGCGVKEVDVSKYLKVRDTGIDRIGKSYAGLNSSFFLDSEIFGKYPISDDLKDSYGVEVIVSPNEDLKNGDEVKLSLKYNEKLYEDNLKVRLSLSETKHKVEGLEKKYLTSSDLSNKEYLKLESETQKKAKQYMEDMISNHKIYTNFRTENFHFVDAYIQNPFDFNSSSNANSNDLNYPKIIYVYKFESKYDDIKKFDIFNSNHEYETKTKFNYVCIPVSDLNFDSKGNLNKYKIFDPLQCNELFEDVPIDTFLSKYFSKDHLEKINIKE